MLDASLCLVKPAATSPPQVIAALAKLLREGGYVKDSFEKAALVREKRSPTGLPFAPWAVALPHAEPEHVVRPAIAVATLASPVAFRQMGSPAVTVPVSIVVMPAFTEKEQAAASLSGLITLLQAEETRVRLVQAGSPEEIHAALQERWPAP